jgi:hypothetical protein
MFHPEHLPTTPPKLEVQLVSPIAVYPFSTASAQVDGVHQSMDVPISAIAGDLVSRSASFLISKYFQKQPGIDEILHRPSTSSSRRQRGGISLTGGCSVSSEC